jgi:hypothetical protein
MADHRREYISWIAVFAAGAMFFRGLTVLLSGPWGFDFFHPGGDVYAYWMESLTWGLPFHPHHPPGYPWLIALLRTASAGRLAPLEVMQSQSFLFLMAGAFLWFALCRREGIAGGGWKAALLFLAWPFVGTLNAVYPQMDSLVLFFLLLGAVLGLDGRWIPAGIAWAAAMVIHPLAWIYVPLLAAVPWTVWILERRRMGVPSGFVSLRQLCWMTLIAAAPLFGLWVWETALTGDPFWAAASIVQEQVASRGSFPILDGWIGTLGEGGISGWAKIGVLAAVAGLAACLLAVVVRNRAKPPDGRGWYRTIVSAVIPAGILGMVLVLNQHEIWAAVRFSKILLLPLILQRERMFGFLPQRLRMPFLYALITAGFLTQIAYAWYMAAVFFSA